ncbi:MAG TPA: PHB depolymerase family esterase [Aliidongia sp.]|nr:PHB depolymerase family esterase [Aliidongia sp.]
MTAVPPLPLAIPLLVLLALPTPGHAADAPTGLHGALTFTDDADLAHQSELRRRLASPLAALRLSRQAEADRPIDLAREKFTLYVPDEAPPSGYALLVFVSPWATAPLPSHWAPVLDRHGMIFVSAADAGNDADLFARRAPLALLAARNVMARYRIDPARLYVGGFSGGARVAERLALGYPDLFRGALLEAGSDPLGETAPPPAADLFHRFQESTRLVYLTGAHDAFHFDEDELSRRSMADWCVFGTATETMPGAGHELAVPAALDRALTALDEHPTPDPARLAVCRDGLERALQAGLGEVEAARAAGRIDEAKRLLGTLDSRFGGLAAPRSLELAVKILGQPG